VEQGAKRVPAYLGGEVVADTVHPRLVWEVPQYPAYYFPVEDVRMDLLVATSTVTHSPSRGDAQHFTVKAGGKNAEDAALRYPDSQIEALRDLIRLDWDAMDGWFEEDEEVYTHPRDPYTRVDILATSRRVRVEIGWRGPGRVDQRSCADRDRAAAALVHPQDRRTVTKFSK
jgi:uncharacterized protein (DUF427 family)